MTMKKLIVANWKSNKNLSETRKWLEQFERETKMQIATKGLHYRVAVAPAFPFLPLVSDFLQSTHLHKHVGLAVQDISMYPAGAYTGAISAYNLEGFDVHFAIVGHSERRRYFHETSQDIAKKVEQALENGITPIVCVDQGEIAEQANAIEQSLHSKLIVAYEPHEYIGTGNIQAVSEVLSEIKEINAAFGNIPVLYGASVNPETMGELVAHQEIAGFLVGTASLDATDFAEMVM